MPPALERIAKKLQHLDGGIVHLVFLYTLAVYTRRMWRIYHREVPGVTRFFIKMSLGTLLILPFMDLEPYTFVEAPLAGTIFALVVYRRGNFNPGKPLRRV